jgi:hypothetical protein
MRKACSGWSKQHITIKELVVGVLRILEAVLVVVGTKAAAWKAWAEAERGAGVGEAG